MLAYRREREADSEHDRLLRLEGSARSLRRICSGSHARSSGSSGL